MVRMQFSPQHIAQIIDETKTETRRLHKTFRTRSGMILDCVSKRGGPIECRVMVTQTWAERLDKISIESARNEGGYTRDNFILGFIHMYADLGRRVHWTTIVKVYKFKVIK